MEDPQETIGPLPFLYLMLGGHNNSKGTILNSVIGKGLEGVMNVAKKGILGTIALRGQATTSIKGRPLNETNAYQLRERKLRKIPNLAEVSRQLIEM